MITDSEAFTQISWHSVIEDAEWRAEDARDAVPLGDPDDFPDDRPRYDRLLAEAEHAEATAEFLRRARRLLYYAQGVVACARRAQAGEDSDQLDRDLWFALGLYDHAEPLPVPPADDHADAAAEATER